MEFKVDKCYRLRLTQIEPPIFLHVRVRRINRHTCDIDIFTPDKRYIAYDNTATSYLMSFQRGSQEVVEIPLEEFIALRLD